MRYRVTCDLVIQGYATVAVEADSPVDAVVKAESLHNLADFDEPRLTELIRAEADVGDVEEVENMSAGNEDGE